MKKSGILEGQSYTLTPEAHHVGQRADAYLAQQFPDYSRSFLQKLFKNNHVLIHGTKSIKPSYIIKSNETITVVFESTISDHTPKEIPSNFQIEIIAKEPDFLIINKPAGLVVHPPSTKYQDITLSDWIIQTHEDIAHVGTIDRPGIVHRLDKETSGLMIIPRTNFAHATFTQMFKERTIHKTYLALATRHTPPQGTIEFYIGRHPTIRTKMHHFTQHTKHASSRAAFTSYQTLQYFKTFSLVEAKPTTGRTHQIRVHFAAIGHPLLGDSLYGSSSKEISRHGLHAYKLEFTYQNTSYSFTAPIPDDFKSLLQTEK